MKKEGKTEHSTAIQDYCTDIRYCTNRHFSTDIRYCTNTQYLTKI